MQYQANSAVVKGYRRLASKSERTCVACLALDNTLQDTAELLAVHPNDRCSLVPETISYRDLGLDVPDDIREPENGRQWFERQPEATQRDMMGKAKFQAWRDGKFQFGDLATVTQNDTWGPAVSITPLKELVR